MENLVQTSLLPNLAQVKNIDAIESEIRKELIDYTKRILELLYKSEQSNLLSIENKKQNIGNLANLKILCVGESKLDRNEIFQIFNDAFHRQFGYDIPKKALDTPVLQYTKMKTFDLIKRIKSDRYDLIIAGPRPHSTANKGINLSLYNLKKRMGLKAITSDNTKDPLHRNGLEEIANTFAIEYKKNPSM